ncbi:putative non-specific lipid-transfer protein 14 [Beta vulgaris subsp. vulgaris]|uniref:putative non-specific lipid-transfer protein 14 n=1 Tax=Beta vulgaris subsp. vulgaris TaxID=3555 RepID=UPI002036700B|nr:putative non-specific lipid-transfer protein 14 [Beta vulgaris subsp. vulgaris]
MVPHNASLKLLAMVDILLILLSSSTWQEVGATVDCPTVTQLLNTCSVFITYGSPDPLPGSPCCDAVMGLSNLGDSIESRRSVCRCMMGLIAAYSPDATSIATLPGFCGVSLGFIIDPNTDCTLYALSSPLSIYDTSSVSTFIASLEFSHLSIIKCYVTEDVKNWAPNKDL